MQKWEYKTLYRIRQFVLIPGEFSGTGRPRLSLSDWSGFEEDTDALPDPNSWAAWLGHVRRLGEDGWELVQIVPRARYHPNGLGTTTEEHWVFKRPKP